MNDFKIVAVYYKYHKGMLSEQPPMTVFPSIVLYKYLELESSLNIIRCFFSFEINLSMKCYIDLGNRKSVENV